MKAILKPTVILFVICALVTALLAGVHVLTRERIAEEEARALREAAFSVIPGCKTAEELEGKDAQIYLGYDEKGTVIGVAITVSQKGYGGVVTVTAGFDSTGKITGVSVSAPEETPGLGANVAKPGFLDQFVGKDQGTVFDIQTNVDRETGASYSSRAVTSGINLASEVFRTLKEEGRI